MTSTGKYVVYRTSRQLGSFRNFLLCLYAFAILPAGLSAQGRIDNSDEELLVQVTVQAVGSLELPVIIREESIYLSIPDLFSFVKIRHTVKPGLDSITGFYLHEDMPFAIDYPHHTIYLGEKNFILKQEDIVRTETNLYLRSELWGEILGLNCNFSFRSLSVNITTQHELPLVRERRLEFMRKNIGRLRGSPTVDTTFRQTYPLFNFGVVDWSVISSQQEGGLDQTLVNLSLGSVIAGGETNVSLNYNSARQFRERDQYYLWRHTNNSRAALRQVLLGKIQSNAISSIFSPVVGLQLTNTPTTFRRSFGSYTLTNTTQAGEIVELYVNNVLVDYTKADASGSYTFQVPLIYGNSEVKTRFYGPWGEERSKTENIIIPFNFLPVGLFEYTISSGIVEDIQNSRFARGHFNYGVTREWTIGGGLEYLSSITTGNTIPFLNSSLRLGDGLVFSADYAHGVKTKGLLNYRWPSNTQLEVSFIKYFEGQRAINVNFLEERRFSFAAPIRSRRFSLFTRLTINQYVLPSTEYNTGEWLVSGSIFGVGAHISTYGFQASSDPYVYSNLALTFRLPKKFNLSPEIQYEYKNHKFISMRCRLEKNILKTGYLSVYYEQNYKSSYNNLGVDIRYDLSFAQLGLTSRRINDRNLFMQSARGSVRYDPATNYTAWNSRTAIGRGNIEIIPFLDINGDGKKDRNEPKVAGLKVRSTGGRMELNRKDSCIRIFDLEAYTSYFIELDATGLDNIAWRLGKKSMNVVVDPNRFKIVPVPVAVLAEISGKVLLKDGSDYKGQGQVIVSFYKNDSTLVGKTLSEADGYFSFLGLPCGKYTARVDSAQLHKLNMKAVPSTILINVPLSREGEVIENINFKLEANKPD